MATETIKARLAGAYAWMIMTGLVLGPVGLIFSMPVIAGIGNALFVAGFFTPVIFTKKLSSKDAIFGGMWSSSVIYFAIEGDISQMALLSVIPLFLFCVSVSKWADASFTQQKN